MNALMVYLVVFLTIVFSLTFGVVSGYALVTGILHLMGHRPPQPAAAALTTAEASSAGD